MVIWSKVVLNLLHILINIYYLLNHHFNFFLSPLNQLSLTLKQAILFYYKNVFSILNCLIVWDVNLLCQLTIHRQLLFCSFCRNIFRAYITSAAVLTVTANYLSQHFIILLGIILQPSDCSLTYKKWVLRVSLYLFHYIRSSVQISCGDGQNSARILCQSRTEFWTYWWCW